MIENKAEIILVWFFVNLIFHKVFLGESFEDAFIMGAMVAVFMYIAMIIIDIVRSKYE